MFKDLKIPGIGFCIASLAFCALAFLFFDAPLQMQFFDPFQEKWSITGAEWWLRLGCYHIPKTFFGGLIVYLIVRALIAKGGTREIFTAFFLSISPISVALLKILTGVECPKDLFYFGGHQPELSLIDSFISGTGRCFPGGHVSAGFGLYAALTLLQPSRRFSAFLAISFLGHFMGFYQIARGYHFISHNLATMGLSYAFFLANQHLLHLYEKSGDALLKDLRYWFLGRKGVLSGRQS
jgi:membrane-associated PAP2 superfamily phosphatase